MAKKGRPPKMEQAGGAYEAAPKRKEGPVNVPLRMSQETAALLDKIAMDNFTTRQGWIAEAIDMRLRAEGLGRFKRRDDN